MKSTLDQYSFLLKTRKQSQAVSYLHICARILNLEILEKSLEYRHFINSAINVEIIQRI